MEDSEPTRQETPGEKVTLQIVLGLGSLSIIAILLTIIVGLAEGQWWLIIPLAGFVILTALLRRPLTELLAR